MKPRHSLRSQRAVFVEQLDAAARDYLCARQEAIALQYVMARTLYTVHRLQPMAEQPIALLQQDAAEASLHIRWLQGIEPSCSCG
jgi:hypothetical protein